MLDNLEALNISNLRHFTDDRGRAVFSNDDSIVKSEVVDRIICEEFEEYLALIRKEIPKNKLPSQEKSAGETKNEPKNK